MSEVNTKIESIGKEVQKMCTEASLSGAGISESMLEIGNKIMGTKVTDTELKLEYLKVLMTNGELHLLQYEERFNRVCDSIEKDLGINKKINLGEVKVSIKPEGIDELIEKIEDVQEALSNLKVKENVLL